MTVLLCTPKRILCALANSLCTRAFVYGVVVCCALVLSLCSGQLLVYRCGMAYQIIVNLVGSLQTSSLRSGPSVSLL